MEGFTDYSDTRPDEFICVAPPLTGSEAAGVAEANLREGLADEGFNNVLVVCRSDDFNRTTGNYILLCAASSLVFRVQVNRVTREMFRVEGKRMIQC
jgi:hypothetical protein